MHITALHVRVIHVELLLLLFSKFYYVHTIRIYLQDKVLSRVNSDQKRI